MDKPDGLTQLSALAGIQPTYTDNWDRQHTTSPTTQRALLAAMGIDVSTPQQIQAALEEREHREWLRPLAPVTVTGKGAAATRLALPKSLALETVEWQLFLENNGVKRGQFIPHDLPLLETRRIESVDYHAWTLALPADPEPGYHQLEITYAGEVLARQSFIVAPATCYQPEAIIESGRIWGAAVQLYSIKSERNWGIGDFTDLQTLLEQWASQGADIIGVNPLHALFPHNPQHASPYSPSSRLFMNVLYLDVEAIADFRECNAAHTLLRSPEFQSRLENLRSTEYVDYSGVAALKLPMLERLYQHFCEHHVQPDSERAAAFQAFQACEGERLYQHCLFEALQEHLHQQDLAIWGWPVWPPHYQQPTSADVREFATVHAERIRFFAYLQWQTDLQLAAVGARSLERGLGVGLYLDLAVSVDGGGAEAWANQTLYASRVGVGAPPELNNQRGQDWGLPPFVPERLREAAYAPFIETLRHNMRHAGALRLDHVMGLMRLLWIPAGEHPTAGAYVTYPFDELLGILALESQRHHCLVIGEDLGTVPPEVRAALAPRGILSYRLLILEKTDDGDFIPPSTYPSQAIAAVSTHDLPTLAGFWEGRDLLRRTELQLFSSEEARRHHVVARAQERAHLLLALEQTAQLPTGMSIDAATLPTMSADFVEAVHVFLARSPAKILMVQLEDALGVLDQINIPSTTTEHPNWRRKLPITLEACATDRRLLSLAAALRQERPRQRSTPLLKSHVHIPRATYRLQFNQEFTFAQATQWVPYLAQLGISHVYCSPYLKARPGSTHGYDIVDHNALNPDIGSNAEYDAFCATLQAHGMRQILDVVPNHMGVMGADNQWWLDVLEHGPASVYAAFFDIDWQPLKQELRGKVLLPILGCSYGTALEGGELKIDFDVSTGSFSVWYYHHRLPVTPREYPRLLRHRLNLLETQLLTDNPEWQELTSLITAFDNLPPQDATATEKILERHRDCELLKRRLAALVSVSSPIRQMLLDTVNDYQGKPGDSASHSLLHALLEAQPWRIANWHVAADEINYRRFFDINDLAALRMEDNPVFEATHQFLLTLIHEGKVDGLRIDHPDGLYDPRHYFQRLQDRIAQRSPPDKAGKGIYILAEKILAKHESLHADWAIHGTTGYDFCNLVNRVFVDPDGCAPLERTYRRFTREKLEFGNVVYHCKHQIMQHDMAGQLSVLAGQLSRICERRPHTRDFTTNDLRQALAEVIACLPVYRTYVRNDHVSAQDRRYVEWSVAQARKLNRTLDASVFDFVSSVLLLDAADGDAAYTADITAFAMKFQQLSSPVMAKGAEDTAFYIYHRLISLNEVGGDPTHFSTSVKAFHAENSKRLTHWPHSMLSTTTHDSKRSEDVRARINVLSEIPAQWKTQVMRWQRLNSSKKKQLDHEKVPSANDEYLIYQTLIGVWPHDTTDASEQECLLARLDRYFNKAIREAKQYTRWVNPHLPYEEGLSTFVRSILTPHDNNSFLADFLPFQRKVANWGMFNSLSQVLLKFTVPGVPDLYQGNELWDFSLVDPDNRRHVDYQRRQHLLAEMKELSSVPQDALAGRVRSLLDTLSDGRAKLYLTWRLLYARQHWTSIFESGAYVPLRVQGRLAEHLCAFARLDGDTTLMVVAPRWFSVLAPLPGDLPLGISLWTDTFIALPGITVGTEGTNVLTGEKVEIMQRTTVPVVYAETLFASFPVALVQF